MENTKSLLGPLLWDVTKYVQHFGASGDTKLFSEGYKEYPILQPAVENAWQDPASPQSALREARALALGQEWEPSKDFEPHPLMAIFSSVKRADRQAPKAWHWSIQPLHELQNALHTVGTGILDVSKLQSHLTRFCAELKRLHEYQSSNKIDTLLPLLEKYFWCLAPWDMPAGTDVPLYALAKMSTAITACWVESNGMLQRPPAREEQAYALICGDISGIQKYIYRISSAKGVAKGLKARSFELALLADAVAKHLLLTFGLTTANLIYSSGGKFYILAPSTILSRKDDKNLASLNEDLIRKFWDHYQGELFLGLGAVTLSGQDFMTENFGNKWQEVTEAANKSKRTKFATIIANNYDSIMAPQGIGGVETTCQVCGCESSADNPISTERPGTPDAREICLDCQSTEKLGNKLAKGNIIAEVVKDRTNSGIDVPRLNPLGLDIAYYILTDLQESRLQGEALTYWNLNIPDYSDENFLMNDLAQPHVNCGFRFYGGNEKPRDEDSFVPLNYDELADASQGIKRLGVLRMDVDFLGDIFREGLRPHNTAARVLTLSWHLNHYFSGHLNELRRQVAKHAALIVYSGGDDLFVVGAWDKLVELAQSIRESFANYTNNPQLTISGGLAMVPKKFPIHKAALFAGDAETDAKQLQPKNKDAFTFLDKPMRWHNFQIASSIRAELQKAIAPTASEAVSETSPLTKGILDRLRRLYLLYDENRRKKAGWPQETPAQMQDYLEALCYDKWRWMLTYSLARFSKNNPRHKSLIDRLQVALIDNKWVDQNGKVFTSKRDIIDFIDVPARWVEFLTRTESD